MDASWGGARGGRPATPPRPSVAGCSSAPHLPVVLSPPPFPLWPGVLWAFTVVLLEARNLPGCHCSELPQREAASWFHLGPEHPQGLQLLRLPRARPGRHGGKRLRAAVRGGGQEQEQLSEEGTSWGLGT